MNVVERDAERETLGGMMLDGSLIDEVAAVVSGADYADPRHERIHDTIVALSREGKPTGPVAVADRLGPDVNRVGGLAYLHELCNGIASPRSAPYYAELVREAMRFRKVRETGVRIQQYAEEGWDALDTVNAARADLDRLVVDEEEVDNEVAVYRAVDSLDDPVGMPTPWKQLDNAIGGWAPGWLYVVGARPATGKTVLGIGVTLDCARRHKAAVLISLEMPKTDLYLRMLAATGSVPGERLLHRTLRPHDWEHVRTAASRISKLPLVVDDRSGLTLAQIRARVRSEQRTREVGAVVVDFLQLVRPGAEGGRVDDRRVQVDLVAMGLKDIARDLSVPVIALAQLNRAPASRADKTPALTDLRESGGIEQAADVVMLLHRDLKNRPDDLQVLVEKNRHGSTGQFMLGFEGRFSRVTDAAYQPSGFGMTA